MDELDTPSILAVGAKLANLARAKTTGDVKSAGVSMAEVDSSREAFALLRALSFDLVAIGPHVADMSPGEFAARLRQAKPWQRWLLIADEEVTAAEEVEARSNGAVAVLEGPDAWKDVLDTARQLMQRHPENSVPGLSLQPPSAAASTAPTTATSDATKTSSSKVSA